MREIREENNKKRIEYIYRSYLKDNLIILYYIHKASTPTKIYRGKREKE